MSSNPAAVRMRRSDGRIDSHVYFPDASVVKPDAGGIVLVSLEYVAAMFRAEYEIIDEADFERWRSVFLNSQ
jgi:hypothetical protein